MMAMTVGRDRRAGRGGAFIIVWGLVVVSVATAILLVWGALTAQAASYRFRMVIEVDTPQGVRSGTGVYEVTARYHAGLQPGGRVRALQTAGDAVAIDLPDGRVLFALLKTGSVHGDLASMSMTALDPAFKNDVVESARRIAEDRGVRASADVAPGNYPMLVVFEHVGDPASVAEVEPANMGRILGPGITLRRILVSTTRDAVTHQLDDRLGPDFWRRWGEISRRERYDGSIADNPFFDTTFAKLSRDAFTSGPVA